jgi:hypothetical protein
VSAISRDRSWLRTMPVRIQNHQEQPTPVHAKAAAAVAYAELRLSSLHVGHAVVDVGCSSGASGVTLLDVDLEMPYASFA